MYKNKTLSPEMFYGSSSYVDNKLKKQIMRMCLDEEESDLTKKITNGFVRLQDITLMQSSEPWGVFSVEKSVKGSRSFFTAKYSILFRVLHVISDYHLYEVIMENFKCHLYFDLEYKKKDYPTVDGALLTYELIEFCYERLNTIWGVNDFEDIVLDASTDIKFSRHVIIRSDKFCFFDNKHVGQFVMSEVITNPKFSFFVDPAVYSRNRNFRIIWSRKKVNGHKSPLVPTFSDDEEENHSVPECSNVDFFMKTLICFTSPECRVIGYQDLDCISLSKTKAGKTEKGQEKQLDKAERMNDLEEFALKHFAPTGFVSKVLYKPEFNTLIFSIEGCRYCQRIGREHKSNHIYLVCKLNSGIIGQRCFDPDCKFFESDKIQIPEDLLLAANEKYKKMESGSDSH